MSHNRDMPRGLENRVYKVKPNFFDFCEVPFIQEGIKDGPYSLPFPLAIGELYGNLFEVRAFKELLILCVVSSLSKSK